MTGPRVVDRALDEPERVERGLPTGGCCCAEHPHRWYERRDARAVWVECNACAEVRDARPLTTAEAWQALGDALAVLVREVHAAVGPALAKLREAGLLPTEPPADPRARALWARQQRGTGPDRQVQHRPRPRRHLP